MKKYILSVIFLTLIAIACMLAATMTVEVPDATVPRIMEAYGSIYNLGRNATAAEVQVMIQGWLQQSTLDYERRKNMAAFSPVPIYSPTPTPTPGGLKAGTAAEPAAATPKKKK